jgi:hypothetical protein
MSDQPLRRFLLFMVLMAAALASLMAGFLVFLRA